MQQPEQKQSLSLELFLSSHSEEELILLRKLVDKLIEEKKEKRAEDQGVPVCIFSQGLNAGEALTKYLKEQKGMRFSEIAELLKKRTNVVWLNYQRACRKKEEELKLDLHERLFIPLYVFKSKLSYLEALVLYLREEMRVQNKEIAELLHTSAQVVSIAYNRAKNKLQNG